MTIVLRLDWRYLSLFTNEQIIGGGSEVEKWAEFGKKTV
jgi:hypothetical protein